eukprot:Amastigsp_a692_22.p3 type:complete len:261 gc:universal Amastigsp_a692_22:940-158(-)
MLPVLRERKRRDRRRVAPQLADALAIRSVPNVNKTVASPRRKGPEAAVEGKRVDWERRLDAVVSFDPVALERELLRLGGGREVEELERDAALDGRERVARAAWVGSNAPRLVLERRLTTLLRLASKHAHIVDVHVPPCGADDDTVPGRVERKCLVRQLHGGCGAPGCARVPNPHGFVPRARDKRSYGVRVAECARGRVVRAELGAQTRGQIDQGDFRVYAHVRDLEACAEEPRIKNRTTVGHMSREHVGVDVVQVYRLIP